MFADVFASGPASADLAIASTTLLGLAGLGYRYLRLRSGERIIIKGLDTGERMHARETLAGMHHNELAANYGMHVNQLNAELKAARMEQWWAGATRGLNSSFTLLPPERASYPELTSGMSSQVWNSRDINDLDDLHKVLGEQ